MASILIPSPALDHPISPAFATLSNKVEDRYDRSFLRRLFSFASSRDANPNDVDEPLVADFAEALHDASVDRPKQVVRDAVRTWNRMAKTIEGWPRKQLPLTDNRGWRALPMSAFPKAFEEDCESYLNRSEGLGLFDERGLQKLSDATKVDRRNKLLQLATRLVGAEQSPSSIMRLADLVEPVAVKLILEALWEEHGRERNAHASNLARLLAIIAQHWVFRSAEEVKRIKAAEARLRPPKQGMTDRNRAKLRPLMDRDTLRKLINLPYKTVDELGHEYPTVSDAVVVQSALAVALLLAAPVREKNLASIDLKKHVQRVSDDAGYLTFPAHEVKNARDLEYPLSPRALRLLHLYIKTYRPLLLKKEQSSKLFVSWTGRQKTPADLGAQIPKFIRTRLGLDVNLHLFRHLAGYVYLSAHPGEYETVRQLLGHKSLKTTIDFYTGLEHAQSFRRYDEILERHREGTHADA
jgi:site-specific recombinase XerD